MPTQKHDFSLDTNTDPVKPTRSEKIVYYQRGYQEALKDVMKAVRGAKERAERSGCDPSFGELVDDLRRMKDEA